MKSDLPVKLKQYFWTKLNKFTNNVSDLKVIKLENGYIKCLWEISATDSLRIKFNDSCFHAIRLFDISNKRNINNSTCIMKEIQVSKFQSSISFPIPINKGVYYFEFGYRKNNGEWRKLAHDNLNMGYRIKKIIQKFDSSNWFSSKQHLQNTDLSAHQKAYQLSLNARIGGSEEINNDNKNQ